MRFCELNFCKVNTDKVYHESKIKRQRLQGLEQNKTKCIVQKVYLAAKIEQTSFHGVNWAKLSQPSGSGVRFSLRTAWCRG